jgi:signal transduction histidine kinase
MKEPFLLLRTRIFFAMILLVFVSFLLIGITTSFQIRENSLYYHELRLDRKEAQLQRAFKILFNEKSIQPDNQLSYLFNRRPNDGINISTVLDEELKDEIFKISDIQNIDFTLYDLDGTLVGSTVNDGVSIKLDNNLIDNLSKSQDLNIVQKNQVNEQLYRSSFSYIMDVNNKPIWILNLPYVDDDRLNAYEIRSFIINIAQVYILLFVLAIIISYFVSSYITNPISELVKKMRQMRLDKSNKKIKTNVSSKEMFTLVSSYNNMVDQIDDNVKQISKSQRELAWREMAKQVAHEIKNPLTPMKLSVQSFKQRFNSKDPKIEEKIQDFSDTLVQQIDVLSSISTAFSHFAELPAQKNENIDIISTTKLALEIFNEKNISFESKIDSLKVKIDRTTLIRIITNLVKNSIQATDNLSQAKIIIRIKKVRDKAIIEIEDNGIGISRKNRDKIFEPKFTTKSKGMGLGLSIIKNLVTNYNGEIDFKSTKGKTIFKIELPIYK